jgi:hypothetical protein
VRPDPEFKRALLIRAAEQREHRLGGDPPAIGAYLVAS